MLQIDWPTNLVLGYASGYDFQTLKPLIYSFLAHVKLPALLVLLSQSNAVPGMPANFSDRIIVQQHALPDDLNDEDLPHPVTLRFYVAAAFLQLTHHVGAVLWLDTRDVFLQRDPFELPVATDGRLHFPRESSGYRLRGPYTDNSVWLLQCYGPETMAALGGMYVLNSGTLLAPGRGLADYFRLMMREFERRWHCRRLHGSDQMVHNYLVYTGKLIGSGWEFQIEDQITGAFAFVAYTHPAVWDFRAVSNTREELYNREGLAMAAIHLWPGENRVADKVVLPFVGEFERCLMTHSAEICSSQFQAH